MNFVISKKGLERLSTVHSDLQKVVKLAITLTKTDFSVIEGLRTIERQKELFATGKSQTMNSRHLTGHAVDLYPWVNGKTSHADNHYQDVKNAMFEAAKRLNVKIEWGGHWKSFIDKPHWQLPK